MKKQTGNGLRKRLLALGAALLLGLNTSTAQAAGKSEDMITINVPDIQNTRPFEGWGTALCWWANRIGYSDELAQKSADLFFGGKKTASCSVLLLFAKRQGLFVRGGYRPGDLVFLRFSRERTSPEHIGLVKEVQKNGTLITIEGNTGVGNDANGGQVQQRTRFAWQTLGGYRPAYEEEEEMAVYTHLSEIPEKFRPIIESLMNAGIIQGDGSDLTGNNDVINLTHEQVRTLVFVYRGGGFDRRLEEAGLKKAVCGEMF